MNDLRKGRCVLDAVPNGVSHETLEETFLTLCESINSPKSLACAILFRSGEHAQMLELKVEATKYVCLQQFADDYFIVSLLSKYKHLSVPWDPEIVAMTKFKECEEICHATNQKFKNLSLDPSKWDPSMLATFRGAQRKIAKVLGTLSLDRASRLFDWGPGATSASKNSNTTVYDKFKSRLDVTSASLIMGHCCVNSIPAWVNCQLQTDDFPSVAASLTRECFSIVRGNEIVFVPKNAKTHRVIAIEPHVNSYLQKGFGSYIRANLRKRAGIDLNDQSINQQLAREGSLNGNLATIDLSSASDTIASQLVKFLLPWRWFVCLDAIRSKQGYLKNEDRWLCYEKFSSMGNGFTFELESLIFWALCKQVQEEAQDYSPLSVYGDDIIVAAHLYKRVAEVLNFAGFTINDQKSFSTGPFRESCGKDYFMGYEVRPIFLKERISNVEAIFKLANGVRRYSHSRNFNNGCDVRFLPAWSYLVHRLSEPFRNLRIPDGKGDGGLVSNWDEARPSLPSFGWDGWMYKELQRTPIKKRMRDRHAAYCSLLSAADRMSNEPGQIWTFNGTEMPTLNSSVSFMGFVTPRNKTYVKVARGHTLNWYDFGSWQ